MDELFSDPKFMAKCEAEEAVWDEILADYDKDKTGDLGGDSRLWEKLVNMRVLRFSEINKNYRLK